MLPTDVVPAAQPTEQPAPVAAAKQPTAAAAAAAITSKKKKRMPLMKMTPKSATVLQAFKDGKLPAKSLGRTSRNPGAREPAADSDETAL